MTPAAGASIFGDPALLPPPAPTVERIPSITPRNFLILFYCQRCSHYIFLTATDSATNDSSWQVVNNNSGALIKKNTVDDDSNFDVIFCGLNYIFVRKLALTAHRT